VRASRDREAGSGSTAAAAAAAAAAATAAAAAADKAWKGLAATLKPAMSTWEKLHAEGGWGGEGGRGDGHGHEGDLKP
jgi:hypothetical protein